MRDWSLGQGDPLSLVLSADSRFCNRDYLNDHIWELSLDGGEPPGVSLSTTYGLRARSMRLFFRFAEAGKSVTDPSGFHEGPRLLRFYSNFLAVRFVPVEGIAITAEFWIPDSHAAGCRLTFANLTSFPRHVDFDLCGVLKPLDGKALGFPRQQQMTRVLSGATGGLQPVVFMTGGPKQGAGPHPALHLGLDFEAGAIRTVAWACAADASEAQSLDSARRLTARNWDAERARIELLNAHQILEIQTGDPDWDAALALSQRSAFGYFLPGGQQLPRPSFVRSRTPDNGFSHKGDGSDYPPSWSGQTPFDAYYVASLLPAHPDLKQGLIENFLSVQAEDGSIDARPGLAGQRSRFLAAPLLASLTWDYFEQTQDEAFLAAAFPRLMAFFQSWFRPARDRDGDGVPEWEHVLQTGLDENPLFDAWYPWSQALNIRSLVNPELESLLSREASALTNIADKLGRTEEFTALLERTLQLTASLAASWDQSRSRYAYRDRRTGASWTDRLVGSRKGPGEIIPRRPGCDEPVRLLLQVHTKAAAATRPTVEIFGSSDVPARTNGRRKAAGDQGSPADGNPQSEQVEARSFQWRSGGLVAVSELVYGRVERVVVSGLNEQDRLVVRIVDTGSEDITLFTPLWARVPDPDYARAMVDHLFDPAAGFDRPFGVPALPASPSTARLGTREQEEAEALAMGIHLPWNNLMGEGLLAYGFREEAARLVTRLMGAIIGCLKRSHAFHERYHAVTGSGLGERHSLVGLAPVGLFLKTLGVQVLSPNRVRLEGTNPYLWPVTIAFGGMRIIRGADSTEVLFPNGSAVTITDPAPCVVSA